MTLTDIAGLRLINQQIAETKFKTVKDLVGWMGAMQAQDFAMVKWAVGTRLPGSTVQIIERAIDNAEIIRTHLLRPTWHLVSADDIHWMLELTAPQIKALLKARHKQLELTDAIVSKSNKIIEKILSKETQVTREEIFIQFEKAKISVNDNRGSHLLLHAELDGLICSGKTKNNDHAYALLNERVPLSKKISRDEALAKLAHKYFSSHCPATLDDFVWWSGLSVTDARRALESVKSNFTSEKINSTVYWLTNSFSLHRKTKVSVHFLPAYDEFIISYKDRSAVLTTDNLKKTISSNGIFYPTIVVDGRVIGLWKRTLKKDKVVIESKLFVKQNNASRERIEKASEKFGLFLNKKSEMVFKN